MVQKIKLTIVLFSFAFAMNAQNWNKNVSEIKGNGNLIKKTISTSEYDEINIGGFFDVIFVNGKEGNISIEGEENIIPFIEIEVQDGNLSIKFKKNMNIKTSKKHTITVPITKISKISLGGSGNISNENIIKSEDFSVSLGGYGNIKLQLETSTTNINIGGSGNIDLSGKTNQFICSIAGAGNVNAFELNSEDSNATIAGSGSVKMTANKKIRAKIVGSGNIYYKGNPTKKDVKSVGSGKIINQN